MAQRVPKVLCHPDGSLFVDYGPGTDHYVVYISDEADPPFPEDIVPIVHLDGSTRVIDIDELVWRPVKMAVAGEPMYVDEVYPYDEDEGGEG